MRFAAAVVFLGLLSGCVGGVVTKTEAVVEMNEYPPRPFNERMKVAVAEFEDRSNYGRGRLGDGASRVMTTLLVKSKQFRVFEREKLKSVLDEQKLGQSGLIDPATATQVGKLIGVDYVIYGAVTKFGFRKEGKDLLVYRKKQVAADSTVDVSVISVKTGEVVFAEQGDGTALKAASRVLGLGGTMGFDETLAENSLRAAIVKMMDNLVETLNEGM